MIKDLRSTSEITFFNNGTLVLIAMEPFKLNHAGIGGGDRRDTLLYELGKKIAYNLTYREAYKYDEINFDFINNVGDTIINSSHDTSIILLKKLPVKVTAVPRLKLQPCGMQEYKTGKITIKLLDYKKSTLDLDAILHRVKYFRFMDKPFQWSF